MNHFFTLLQNEIFFIYTGNVGIHSVEKKRKGGCFTVPEKCTFGPASTRLRERREGLRRPFGGDLLCLQALSQRARGVGAVGGMQPLARLPVPALQVALEVRLLGGPVAAMGAWEGPGTRVR